MLSTPLKRGLLAGATALALTAFIAPPSALAQDSTTWRVQSHWPSSSSSYDDSLVRIKNVIEERTDGRVKLKLYPSGALFKAQQTFDAVKRGTIQMGTIAPAYAQNQMSLAGNDASLGGPFAQTPHGGQPLCRKSVEAQQGFGAFPLKRTF